MDNAAFRNLLSSNSGASSSSKAAGGTSSRAFGAAPKRRGDLDFAAAQGSLSFAPRSSRPSSSSALPSAGTDKPKNKGKKPVDPNAPPKEPAYRDRAKERRQGKDHEYSAVEGLYKDFKDRSDANNVDLKTFQEQVKFLGGDSAHSILAKGLDRSLLGAQKDAIANAAEGELDALADELLGAPPTTGQIAAGGASKRSRDDTLRELKKAAEAKAKAAGMVSEQPQEGKTKASEAPLGKGFKRIGEPEKPKKRKKVKVAPPPAESAVPAAAVPAAAAAASAPRPVAPVAPAPKKAPPPPPVDEGYGTDDDIFGGVDDWEGEKVESGSDSEGEVNE